MMRAGLPGMALGAAVLVLGCGTARAAAYVAPPLMYAPGLWQGRGQAVLRVLDRLDSHVETITVGVDETAHYKSLDIAVHRCLERPKTVASDAAVQATITDTTPAAAVSAMPGTAPGDAPSAGPSNGSAPVPATTPAATSAAASGAAASGGRFDGWMVASVPSLSMLESALYEVHVIGCAGPMLAPTLPPLTSAAAQADAGADTQGSGTPGAEATGQPLNQTPGNAPVPLDASSGPAPTPLLPNADQNADQGTDQGSDQGSDQAAPQNTPQNAPQGTPRNAPAPRQAGPAPTPLLPPDAGQDAPAPAPQGGQAAPSQGEAPLPPPTPLVPPGG